MIIYCVVFHEKVYLLYFKTCWLGPIIENHILQCIYFYFHYLVIVLNLDLFILENITLQEKTFLQIQINNLPKTVLAQAKVYTCLPYCFHFIFLNIEYYKYVSQYSVFLF